MNRLFVLHQIPHLGVPFLADIHLRPSLLASAKILISAINLVSPSSISVVKSENGIREYRYEEIPVLPPYPRENPWVNWVGSNYYHFWWLIETAWHLDKELTHRFYLPQSDLYLNVSKLVEDGVARLFPKPDKKGVGAWPANFIITSDDEIKAHQDFYKSLKAKVRMKWTNRETPPFMLDQPQLDLLCPQCLAPKPLSGACDAGCYYANN